MRHETLVTPVEVEPGRTFPSAGVLPTFLKKNKDGTLDYVINGELNVDDIISPWACAEVTVGEILVARRANGDWSAEVYSKVNPMFYKIKPKTK